MEVKFTKEYLEARKEYFKAIDSLSMTQLFNYFVRLIPTIHEVNSENSDEKIPQVEEKEIVNETGNITSNLISLFDEKFATTLQYDELVFWYFIKALSENFKSYQELKNIKDVYSKIKEIKRESISKKYPKTEEENTSKQLEEEENTSKQLKEDNDKINQFTENYKTYIKKYEKKSGLIVGLFLLVLVLAGIGVFLFYLFTPAKMDDAATGIVVEVTPENKLEKIGGYEVLVEEVEEYSPKDYLIKTAFGNGLSNYKAYDISLAQGDKEYSFAGEAKLRFPRPESVNKEKVAVYWVSNEGKIEEYQTNYIAATDTISIVTTHFSVFVVTEKPCVVTFENEGEVVSEQRVTWGNTADLPKEPQKIGYTFLGWFVNGEKVNESNRIYEDLTIEAKWKGNEYTVTLDANEGTVQEKNIVVTYDENTVLEDPRREGYEFLGWYEGDKKFESGVWKTARNVTLTAKWRIQEYTVVYELNGGTNNRKNPIWYNVLSGMVTLEDPTREGYTFEGWYEDANYRKRATSILPGSTGDKTFYAKWSPNEYTIFFNANGGMVSPNSTMLTYDSSYGSLPTPTPYSKEGYTITFNCWFTAQTGGTRVTDTTKVTTAGSHTLYAQWTEKANEYTVYLNATEGMVSDGSRTVTYASTYGALPTPTSYSKEGYTVTFNGWYTEKYGGTRITDTTTVTMAANHTLYAQWTEKANEYTVSFNANGGTVSDGSRTVTYDSTYGSLPTPTSYSKEGYTVTFNGWFTAQTGGTRITDTTKVTTTGNHTLYAQWMDNSKTYNLKFDTDESAAILGKVIGSVSANKQVTYGETVDLPTLSCDYCTFNGWLIGDSTTPVNSFVVTDVGENNAIITVKASWKRSFTEISNSTELSNIRNNPSGTFVLMNDIDLKGVDWSPISTFSGTLDGNNHVISNLSYTIEKSDDGNCDKYGMFQILSGTVKNVGFTNLKVSVYKYRDGLENLYVGGICGVLSGGTIENCHINGSTTISGDHYREVKDGNPVKSQVGGFVGAMMSGTITKCRIDKGSVYGKAGCGNNNGDCHANVGGIVGEQNGGEISSSFRSEIVTIKSVVRGNTYWWGKGHLYSRAGGIVGYQGPAAKVSSCTSSVQNISAEKDIESDWGKDRIDLDAGKVCGKQDGSVS